MIGNVTEKNPYYNYFQSPGVNERGAEQVYGGDNFFVNPGAEITSFTSNYNISLPPNFSYTTDVDGTPISMGNDGVGLAHVNPNEHKLHLIG